ncbi:hypothetical protein [Bacteroides sp. 224]|uniref:hypothetical protein n=1 Tax=Bacteroides sp. 224 TaxID=2302936 RepID=UPI0013D12176|nr:hypothetical protein [Bacteroides sp. 224]NDV64016.1 hypothetical protein [Bacteroides sp. 224]
MNNSFFIRATMTCVPLKADNGSFEIKSDDEILLSVSPSIERLFLFWIYAESAENKVAEWLRNCWDKNITPMKIDQIINLFKSSHPVQKLSSFPLKDTPLYATEENGIQLPLPYECCFISQKDEKELMDLIVTHKNEALEHIILWFVDFRKKYNLNYPKMVGLNIDYELAISFINQHGFSIEILNQEEITQEQKKYKLDTTVATLLMLLPMFLLFRWAWINDFLLFKKSIPLAIICGMFVGGIVILSFNNMFLRTKRINIFSVFRSLFVGTVVFIFVFLLYLIIQFFI